MGLRGQRTTPARSISAGTAELVSALDKLVRALRSHPHGTIASRDALNVRLRARTRARAQTGVIERNRGSGLMTPNTTPNAAAIWPLGIFGGSNVLRNVWIKRLKNLSQLTDFALAFSPERPPRRSRLTKPHSGGSGTNNRQPAGSGIQRAR